MPVRAGVPRLPGCPFTSWQKYGVYDPGCGWCAQEDLKHLRSLWDMVTVVMGAFTSWCTTLWDKIDVDFLVEETKRLAKEIRTLNKVVRVFDVYRYTTLLPPPPP